MTAAHDRIGLGSTEGSRSSWGHRIRLIAFIMVAVTIGASAGAAWAYWLATTTAGSNGASAATSVNAGATPTASAAGTAVTVSWSASTLATGQAVTGYLVKRYDASTLVAQTILSACSGTVASTSCVESSVPGGSWKYSVTPVFATNWVGAESAKSATVTVDSTPPTNSLTLSNVSGGAYLSGSTVYYAGAAAGSFTLRNAVADAGSGPASSQTAALTGTTTGWTHTPSTVSTPAGGPYVSASFTWTAGTTSGPGEVVTGRDVAGNATTTSLTFVNDSTAPSAGSISYLDGYQPGLSVPVTFAAGTDGGSGLATRQLQRSYALLTNGVCGTFNTFSNISVDNPTSIYTDSAVSNSTCYKYRFVVTDNVGNQTIATSASVSKVDYGGAVFNTSGLLSQWRLGQASASSISLDSFTGADGTALGSHTGELGATWNVTTTGTASAQLNTNTVSRTGLLGSILAYTSTTPATADYAVEADLIVRSNLGGDDTGVIGRRTAGNNFYLARWDQGSGHWQLAKYNGLLYSVLAATTSPATLTVGDSYRLKLEMIGSTLNLYVDGLLTVTTTDTSLPATGSAGIIDGVDLLSAQKTSTTGLHIDNFQVIPSTYPRAVDSKGSNTGDYNNGPTLGVPGALSGDTDTAAQFDGLNDYVQMTGTTGLPVGASARSTELWFKTTSSAQEVLFAYGSFGGSLEYGLWLNAGGTGMTAWGNGGLYDKSFTLSSAVNDGHWHQVVETYDGTTILLYIDGTALTGQAATRGTVLDMHGFSIGAILEFRDGNYGEFFNGTIDEVSFYTTTMPAATVTNHYQLGNAPAADITGPTGGSVDATGLTGTGSRYSTSTTLSIALAKGSDPSGLATSGNTLQRATATLTSGGTTNGVCGTYGSYSLVTGGTDPATPYSDTVTDQACYSYRYTVLDAVGNATTYTSGDIKVDATGPSAPTLAFSAFTNTYWTGAGSTVYYRSGAASGSFTSTAASTDTGSGITNYTYPALGANWTSTPGALGVTTYSWSGAPAAPGTVNVTATNNAGGVSAGGPLTMVADTTAPSAGTVSYVNGSTGGTTVSVTFTTGTDGGSGIGTRLLQRASAPLTGITCGSYGAFATVTGGTNPTSPLVDTVTTGNCYQYQYVVTDNVGNTQTATSTSVAHTPYGAYWAFNAGTGTSAVDSFGNSNTGTLQAGAGWTTGKIGSNALNLNGTNTSWMSAANPVIDSSQSYTVATWVKLNNLTGFQTFASIDGTAISPFYLQLSGGVFDFAQRGSDSTSAVLTQVNGLAPTVGTWYYVAGVYNQAANTMELFVNGVSQGSVTAGTVWKATGTTTVGRAKWNGAGVDFTNGALDETRFYDRVLSADELTALAGAYSTRISATPGLLNYWRLGEPSGTSAVDAKSADNGTYVGTPTFGAAGAITNDSNTAVQFNGTSQYAWAARQISADFSIEFWFKSTQSFSNDLGNPHCTFWWQGAGLVDADTGGSANDFGISLCSGQVIGGVGGNPDPSIISPATYNDGAWHQVVMTRTQSTGLVQLYVDGASVGSVTGTTNALTSTATMDFGRSTSGGNYLAGTLDEIAMYNVALSAATIASHYVDAR